MTVEVPVEDISPIGEKLLADFLQHPVNRENFAAKEWFRVGFLCGVQTVLINQAVIRKWQKEGGNEWIGERS